MSHPTRIEHDLVVALACVKQAAAPPGTQPAARDALPGLDAIRERQRREDAAKKQQK